MAHPKELLFVYGTLRRGAFRDGQPSYFAQRLEAEADWLGPARVPGKLYQVNPEYPGLAPPEQETDWVHGEVWQFADRELWQALDNYEGEEYLRSPTVAVMASEEMRPVWVYLYASKITTAMAIVEV